MKSSDHSTSSKKDHILIIEPRLNTGHGPIYLSSILKACQRTNAKITIIYPIYEKSYHQLIHNANLDVEEICVSALKSKNWWNKLDQIIKTHKPDLVFFTLLDLLIKSTPKKLSLLSNIESQTTLTGLLSWSHIAEYIEPKWLLKLRLIKTYKALTAYSFITSKLKSIFAFEPATGASSNIITIPDAWTTTAPAQSKCEVRELLNIEQSKIVFLHIGVDDYRKGIPACISCFGNLDESSNALLIRAGATTDYHKEKIEELEDRNLAKLINRRVEDYELDQLAIAADYILLPYRSHRGSSGIMSIARAHQTPVIASNYGMIGQIVSKEQGGFLYKNKSTSALQKQIQHCLELDPSKHSYWTNGTQGFDELENVIFHHTSKLLEK